MFQLIPEETRMSSRKYSKMCAREKEREWGERERSREREGWRRQREGHK